MKIAVVLTYPIYHDGWKTADWLRLENRDRWLPGVLIEMGHEAELWAGDHARGCYTSQMSGFTDYPIRLFETDARGHRTKFHASTALTAHAAAHPADLYLLKGVDGGIGETLLRRHVLPEQRPFAYIVGGKYRGKHARRAVATLYESEYQAEKLRHPALPWQPAIPLDRLIPLAKSVDLEVFRPLPEEKRYDVLAVSRLDRRNKSFHELGALSAHVRVAVVGGGPDEAALRAAYPRITWLGRQPNADVPRWMNRTHLVLHNGVRERRPTRDFYPRVLAESLACGVPPVAFADLIQPDVLPDGVGLRVARGDVVHTVTDLLADPARLAEMQHAARAYAEAHLGKRSSRPAMEALLQRVEAGR